MRLRDKVAIITGAGSGYGEGTAHRFVAEGAAVVAADIVGERAEGVAAGITDKGGRAVACQADVALSADVKRMVDLALQRFGRLDIVVNNAGITHRNRPMLEVDEETFDRVFAVNVKSIYLSAVHAVPVFRKQGGGVFINVASTAGLRPRPGLTWYNGSKAAAIVVSKSMAVELAPDKIRVNAICPVIGETGLTAEFMGGDSPELRARFAATIPLGRFSRPSDIANAAVFLAEDASDFITGVALEVDGGRCV
jgi:3-oxoacyl-[acyl-carrier protein] reductase